MECRDDPTVSIHLAFMSSECCRASLLLFLPIVRVGIANLPSSLQCRTRPILGTAMCRIPTPRASPVFLENTRPRAQYRDAGCHVRDRPRSMHPFPEALFAKSFRHRYGLRPHIFSV